MASLKEVKGRILSVSNTRKITSAMKMLASAKLHKAEEIIGHMLPYEQSLHRLFHHLMSDPDLTSVYTEPRETKRVALVVFSSNTSLCGGFNANVIRRTTQWLNEHRHLGKENILLFPVGKKVADALVKQGWPLQGDFQHLADKPSYAESSRMASQLIELFLRGEVDQIELLYNHFKSTSSQILTQEVYLPFVTCPPDDRREEGARVHPQEIDYILEPSREDLLAMIVPQVLRMKLYTVLLDSNTSEHGARTLAMQIATDNADNLIQDLTLVYNKTRQQTITNELLDMVSGTMG